MKHTFYLLAATTVLSLSAMDAAKAESAQAGATATTSATAQADGAQEPGLMDTVKGWFSSDTDAQAEASAQTAPAAGQSQQAQPSRQPSQARSAPSANDTNPVVGEVLTEGAANVGIRTNAQMGAGAAGSVGNQ